MKRIVTYFALGRYTSYKTFTNYSTLLQKINVTNQTLDLKFEPIFFSDSNKTFVLPHLKSSIFFKTKFCCLIRAYKKNKIKV